MADTIPELTLKSSVVGDESIPADNGVQTYRVTPSQIYDYMRTRFVFGAGEISNLAIATAVGSNALTISLKTKANADASSSDPIRVAFRSATLTSGLYNSRTITGSISLVISSGSTLGQTSGQPSRIWVYLIDNAGTLELAVSGKRFRDDELVSTTAEGGAGAADSHQTMYSASARSSVPCRCIGYIDNTQATAGTWASAGSQIQIMPVYTTKRPTLSQLTSGSGTYYKPAGCTRIKVLCTGGGAGGAGGGTTSPSGSAGGDTTFGSITAGGGPGSAADFGGTSGGTGTGGDFHVANRGPGTPGNTSATNWGGMYGGNGANGPRGGMGGNGGNNAPSAGGSGSPNTGAGGGGGGGNAAGRLGGPGGGSGAFVEKLIVDPDASYAYSVGGAGAGGSAGTGGGAGGAGGSGLIIVEEYYD